MAQHGIFLQIDIKHGTIRGATWDIVNQPSPELKPLMAFFVNATLCDLNYSLYQRGTDSGGYLPDI